MRRTIFLAILLSLFVIGCNSGGKDRKAIRAYKLFNKALEYNLADMDSLALPLYDSAIILAPDRAEFYTNRGYTRYRLSDTLGALSDYYRAIELDSLDVTTYMNLESVLSDGGNYAASVKYACKALELGHTPAYFVAGQDLYMLGEYEASIDAFLNYVERTSDSQVFAFYCLGHSYARLEQMENARLCWDKANELAGYDIVVELDNKPGNKFLVH